MVSMAVIDEMVRFLTDDGLPTFNFKWRWNHLKKWHRVSLLKKKYNTVAKNIPMEDGIIRYSGFVAISPFSIKGAISR